MPDAPIYMTLSESHIGMKSPRDSFTLFLHKAVKDFIPFFQGTVSISFSDDWVKVHKGGSLRLRQAVILPKLDYMTTCSSQPNVSDILKVVEPFSQSVCEEYAVMDGVLFLGWPRKPKVPIQRTHVSRVARAPLRQPEPTPRSLRDTVLHTYFKEGMIDEVKRNKELIIGALRDL